MLFYTAQFNAPDGSSCTLFAIYVKNSKFTGIAIVGILNANDIYPKTCANPVKIFTTAMGAASAMAAEIYSYRSFAFSINEEIFSKIPPSAPKSVLHWKKAVKEKNAASTMMRMITTPSAER